MNNNNSHSKRPLFGAAPKYFAPKPLHFIVKKHVVTVDMDPKMGKTIDSEQLQDRLDKSELKWLTNLAAKKSVSFTPGFTQKDTDRYISGLHRQFGSEGVFVGDPSLAEEANNDRRELAADKLQGMVGIYVDAARYEEMQAQRALDNTDQEPL